MKNEQRQESMDDVRKTGWIKFQLETPVLVAQNMEIVLNKFYENKDSDKQVAFGWWNRNWQDWKVPYQPDYVE